MRLAPEEFDDLEKLLAFKRHEQPPPGFFEDFPERVMARLMALEATAQQPWWVRWQTGFGLQPALVGAFGVAVVAVYFLGLSLANYAEQGAPAASGSAAQHWVMASPLPVAPLPIDLAHQPLGQSGDMAEASSMNPVVSSRAPRGIFTPGIALYPSGLQPVQFHVSGN